MANDMEAIKLRINGSAAGLQASLTDSRNAIQRWASSVNSQTSQINSSLGRLSSGFGALRATIAGLAGGAALRFGIGVAAEAEQALISFKVLLGSAEKAKTFLAELKQFAAATPFEFPEIRAAANQLLGFQFEAKQILPLLRQLGDLASGTNQPLGELAYLVGTSASAGRIMTADLNQFAGRGLPILDALGKALGVQKSQVRGLAEQGKISFADLSKAIEIMAGQGGLYFGMMDEQSRSLLGKWSTLKDSIGELSGKIGNIFVPALKQSIDGVSNFLTWLQTSNSLLKESVVQIVAFAAGWAAFALGAPRVVAGLIAITKAIRALILTGTVAQGMTGVGLLKALGGMAAGAAVAYGVGQLLDAQIGDLTAGMEDQAAAAAGVADGVGDVVENLEAWQSKAASIRQTFQSPFETFKGQILELANAVRLGGLEWGLFEKGAAKALETLRATFAAQQEAAKPKFVDTFAKNSAEEIRFKFQLELNRNAAKEVDQLAELQQATALLQQIRDELRKPETKRIANF